jgi:hypothetical protein
MSSKSKSESAAGQARLKLKGQKEFVIDGDGGLLSPFGGLPLVMRLEEHEQLIARASECIPDWRKCPEMADYSINELLNQRTGLVACGLPDAIDCSGHAFDPGLLSVLGKETGQRCSSQSSQTRMEQSMTADTIERLEGIFLEHFFESHPQNVRELTINGDSSAIRAYGNQQGAMHRGGKYAGKPIFYPLEFTTDSGWLLKQELRFGSASDANAGPVIRDLTNKLQERYPGIRLHLRLDTGFNDPELLQYLDVAGIRYECGYPFTSALKVKCKDVMVEVEAEFRKRFGEPKFLGEQGKKKFQEEHRRIRSLPAAERTAEEAVYASRRIRKIVEEFHLGDNWDYDRRVIVRAEYTDSGLDVRCVVTSEKNGLPRSIYEEEYCKRSRIEPLIHQLKGHCRVPLSAQEFTSNQFRHFLQGLAYQLLQLLRRFLPGNKSTWSIATLRSRLLLVPVLIVPTARRIYWHLSSVYAHHHEYLRLVEKLNRLV